MKRPNPQACAEALELGRVLERVQQSAWLNVESDIHPESVGLSDEDKALIESALEQAARRVTWAKLLHDTAPPTWIAIDVRSELVVGEVHRDSYDGLWDAELHSELADGGVAIEVVKQKCLRLEHAKDALEKALETP